MQKGPDLVSCSYHPPPHWLSPESSCPCQLPILPSPLTKPRKVLSLSTPQITLWLNLERSCPYQFPIWPLPLTKPINALSLSLPHFTPSPWLSPEGPCPCHLLILSHLPDSAQKGPVPVSSSFYPIPLTKLRKALSLSAPHFTPSPWLSPEGGSCPRHLIVSHPPDSAQKGPVPVSSFFYSIHLTKPRKVLSLSAPHFIPSHWLSTERSRPCQLLILPHPPG